jgi:hypothetical protein
MREDKGTFRVFSDFWEENNVMDIINDLAIKAKKYCQEVFEDEEKNEIASDNVEKKHTLDEIVEETKDDNQQSDELEIQIEQPPK